MKITIIPSDSIVAVDGVAYFNIDLSWIPDYEEKTIHAVHWDDETEEGEIEFVGPAQPLQTNVFGIDGFCVFTKALSQWQEKRDEELAFIEQERIAEDERKKKEEEMRQAQFLDFNREHLSYTPREDDEEGEDVDTDTEASAEEEDDLFYDIEELLKEI